MKCPGYEFPHWLDKSIIFINSTKDIQQNKIQRISPILCLFNIRIKLEGLNRLYIEDLNVLEISISNKIIKHNRIIGEIKKVISIYYNNEL